MPVECPKCTYPATVPPGERPPPWCPRCGADLKASAMAGAALARADGFPTARTSPPSEVRTLARDVQRIEPGTSTAVMDAPRLVAPPAPDTETEASHGETDSVVRLEVFRTNILWHAVAWCCMVVCFGIVAVAVSQAIKPPKSKSSPMGVYGCMGLFSIGGLMSVYVAFRFAGQKYEVFSDRLVEWQCFKPTTYRWDQIREVFQSRQPTGTAYRVTTGLGRQFMLRGDLWRHKKLGDLISGHVAALSLPGALHQLESGQDVSFGPMRVNRGGVIVNGEMQPWHRIGVLTLGLNPKKRVGNTPSRVVHLRVGDVWVELGDIPNYPLFEALASHLFPASVPS